MALGMMAMNEPPLIVDQLLAALKRQICVEGSDLRPVHAIGIGVTGSFRAAPNASAYCVAEHFRGDRPVDVTVRFSNGSGDAEQHDGWSDVRGMATRFHLANDDATDLIAMTLPEFFTATPEAFLDFLETAKLVPAVKASPWRKFLDLLQLTQPMPDPYPNQKMTPVPGAITYADQHKAAQIAVLQAAIIGAPVSYARALYHAVHAFGVIGADGVRRWVRFFWTPAIGVQNTDPTKPPIDKYLQDELKTRLKNAPVRFTLMMTIGESGDDPTDSSRPWPPNRKRVVMGELTLDKIPEDQINYCEKLSFNPWPVVPGIEPSGDPVLQVRRDTYQVSSKQRHGMPCPFLRRSTDGE
jgi:catalase